MLCSRTCVFIKQAIYLFHSCSMIDNLSTVCTQAENEHADLKKIYTLSVDSKS